MADSRIPEVTFGSITNLRSGQWTNSTIWNTNKVPTSTDNVFVTAANSDVVIVFGEVAHNLTIGSKLDILHTDGPTESALALSGNLTVNKGGILFVDGSLTVNGFESNNINNGTIKAGEGGTIEFAQDVWNNAGGTIQADKGGLIIFDATLVNWPGANLIVNGGEVDVLGGAFAGTGNQGIADLKGEGSVLKFLGGGPLNVTFDVGSQQLVIDHSSNYSGTIQGFAATDTIDVLDIDHASPNFHASYRAGNLTLTDGVNSAAIKLVGVDGLNLTFSDDFSQGTLIGLA